MDAKINEQVFDIGVGNTSLLSHLKFVSEVSCVLVMVGSGDVSKSGQRQKHSSETRGRR